MTVRFMRFVWLLGSLLAFTLVVNAQSEVLTVHVPFAFVAGGKLMPAGDYRVDRQESSNVLLMHGGSGNSSTFLTMAVDSYRSTDGASLVFEHDGATLVLSVIRLPGQQSRVVIAPHVPAKAGIAAMSVSSR